MLPKRRPLSQDTSLFFQASKIHSPISVPKLISDSAQFIHPPANETLGTRAIPPELIQQLISTKSQVDKIIRCLLRSIPFSKPKNHVFLNHLLPDLASSLNNFKKDLLTLDDQEEAIQPPKSRTRAHSWPPLAVSTSEALMTRVEHIAFRILQTSVIAMIDTDVASDLMKSLQTQLEFQKNLTGDHSEANDLLTKLLFIFAPLLRMTESLARVLAKTDVDRKIMINYLLQPRSCRFWM